MKDAWLNDKGEIVPAFATMKNNNGNSNEDGDQIQNLEAAHAMYDF